MLRPAIALLAALALLAPATAAAAPPNPCPGDPIAADRVIEGSFGQAVRGGHVLVPFDVPAGTTAVRVKYCFDQPENPQFLQSRHTLDLGLYGPRPAGGVPGPAEFRGWGGSSHPDVTVSARGFSSEEAYRARPRGHVAGKTTRGFRPGPIEPGEWTVELGTAAIIDQDGGDATGEVGWRVEIELSEEARFAQGAYRPRPYNRRPARTRPGWYEGDLHVHGEHSALGDATMREVFDFAFSRRGADLDFITLNDYVTDVHWGEIGRFQRSYPGRLIARGAEVITYRGHTNNQASATLVDYRTGPIFERRLDGSVFMRRAARSPREIFRTVQQGRGWTQVNHPRFFEDPATAAFCRGCAWSYSDRETHWDRVDAYEVHTGPGRIDGTVEEPIGNPFTPAGIEEWDSLRRRGYDVTAVASSDSHHAGETPEALQSPIGTGRTVVFARELSEAGVRAAIRRGNAYVKPFGEESPNVRLEARAGRRGAIMGGTIEARSATLEARVSGGVEVETDRTLVLIRDGRAIESLPITSRRFVRRFMVSTPGEYRIEVRRGAVVDALTNPIRLRR